MCHLNRLLHNNSTQKKNRLSECAAIISINNLYILINIRCTFQNGNWKLSKFFFIFSINIYI